MFSPLNDVSQTSKLKSQIEQNDTRLGLTKREQDAGAKKDKQEKSSQKNETEDMTTVSIAALCAFLRSLQNKIKTKDTRENKHRNQTTKAAMAAQSYKNNAEKPQTSIFQDINENSADITTINTVEITAIETILEELQQLLDRNIE